MKSTIEQRVATLETQVAALSAKGGKTDAPKKGWLNVAGKLKRTKVAVEADRLGREFREEQNRKS
jgi:hypothetical protein